LYVEGAPTYTRLNTGLPALDANSDSDVLSTNRLDVPLYLGWKMLGIIRIYGGPVYSFNLGTKFKEVDYDLTLEDKSAYGYHIGTGVELGPIMVDLRYEGAISHKASFDIQTQKITLDNKGAQVLLSVGYKF
jgi:opacity protein-like surface antigen